MATNAFQQPLILPQYTIQSNGIKGITSASTAIPPSIAEYYGAVPYKQSGGFKTSQVDTSNYTHTLLCSYQAIVCFLNLFFD